MSVKSVVFEGAEVGLSQGQVDKLVGFNLDVVQGNTKAVMKEVGASSGDLWKVPRSAIKVMKGFNPRVASDPEYVAHIRNIANSIKSNGFYAHEPLAGFVAREDGQEIIYVSDGHTRLAAFDLAVSEGTEDFPLPVVVSPRGTNMEDLTVGLITKNNGRDLTAFEKAIVVKRLASFGWETDKISERTGISCQRIDDMLTLMSAPLAVRQMVESGEVAVSKAIAEVKEKGAGAAASLQTKVEEAKAKGHKRVTNRSDSAFQAKQSVKKQAPRMLELLKSVQSDEAFEILGEETRQAISALLESLQVKDDSQEVQGTQESHENSEKVQDAPIGPVLNATEVAAALAGVAEVVVA